MHGTTVEKSENYIEVFVMVVWWQHFHTETCSHPRTKTWCVWRN